MAANEVLPNSDDKDVAKRWDAQNLWDDELDEHINAILRNAGVQINEADDEVAVNTNVGEPVTDESLLLMMIQMNKEMNLIITKLIQQLLVKMLLKV